MRTLVVTQNVTVDGAIEMLGDWFEGPAQADQSDLLAELHRGSEQSDALLVGRRTFEDMRGFWPHQTDDRTGVTDHLNRVAKYIVSSTMTDPAWDNSTVLVGDPVEQVRSLKDRPGRQIVLTGSITLCHALIEVDLVDEFRLFTYPVVQGRGRRLFPTTFEPPRLTLMEAKSFRSGITFARYRVQH